MSVYDLKRKLLTLVLVHQHNIIYLAWAIFVTVGALQMCKVRGGFITNYGADIIAPIMVYYGIRTNKTILSRFLRKGTNPIQTLVIVWTFCIVWEICQKFDLSGTVLVITRGTFDIWDIVVYSATLVICYYFDISLLKLKREN